MLKVEGRNKVKNMAIICTGVTSAIAKSKIATNKVPVPKNQQTIIKIKVR